jgi:HlyD family secretion protein
MIDHFVSAESPTVSGEKPQADVAGPGVAQAQGQVDKRTAEALITYKVAFRDPQSRHGAGMKKWKKTALIVGALVVLVALVVGGISWSKRGTVGVQIGRVARADLSSLVTASGEIKPPPENLANVNANSMGKIVQLLVKEGQHVKRGQLLLRTEDIQQSANVDAQIAALRTQESDASAMDAAVNSASAALKTAEADLGQSQAKFMQSRDDFLRGEQLLKDKLIAQQIFDQRRSDYHVAQATVQSAEAHVNQAKAQYQQAVFNRDMSKGRIIQNQAQLVAMRDVREKTIYRSPLDGIVTSLPVHLGENVVPGIQNQVGSVLFQVSDLSVITAEVKVDETDIVNVRLGQPADVTIDAIPNKTFQGHVTEIGQSAVSATTGQTTTTTTTSGTTSEEAKDFKVVVKLNNPPPGLRPGLSTTAKITTATRQNAVTIPIQALTIRTRRELEENEKGKAKAGGQALAATRSAETSKEKDKGKEELQGVFVIRNGRATFVPVETGIMGVTDVEVTKGLQPGDEIVTGTYQVLRTLKNNTKVKLQQAPPPGQAPEKS